MSTFYVSNTTYSKLSARHAILSCNCDQNLATTSYWTIISASNLELMCHFALNVTRKNAMVFRTQLQLTHCKVRDKFCAFVELWLSSNVLHAMETA